jgi:CheY-like chemotaxis protein
MNAIIGMADLLSETDLTPEQQEFVQIFQSSGHNLLSIIDDILDISKVEAGRLSLEEMGFDLIEVMERTCEIMALRAHEKGLELTCRIRSDVPTLLSGDAARLRQILVNLIGNAVKFTERGEVHVEVQKHDSERKRGAGEPVGLVFSIADTGIGIPAEKTDAIFDIFTQADSSTTRSHGGTGLGLTISKRLVELMDGRIWVESRVGEGSTFHFTAGFRVQPEPDGTVPRLHSGLQGSRILVVDDSVTNRKILEEMLSQWGAAVTAVESGKAGLVELKQAARKGVPYRLAVVDSRMPNMDGFEFTERVNGAGDIAVATVMMLTSDRRTRDLVRCHELGVTYHVVKPIKRTELIGAVSGAVGDVGIPREVRPTKRVTSSPDLRSLHILLVEDAAENRLLIRHYLRKTPHYLDTAEDGQAAWETFQSGKYDLILMDMQMPVMDGYTATRKIKSWERETGTRATPIIALTAYANKDEERKGLEAGCVAYLTKPISRAELLGAIRSYTQPRERVAAEGKGAERIIARVDAELKDLMPGFLGNRRQDVIRLRDALARGDYESIRITGHTLKGGGGGYGLDAITRIGRAIESAARGRDTTEIKRQIHELSEYLEHVEIVYTL